MTNVQIIEKAKLEHKIEEQVNTYQGWKREGHQVKKGQKALFQTLIWKPITKKKKDDEEEIAEADEELNQKMILVKASFFGASQVEK